MAEKNTIDEIMRAAEALPSGQIAAAVREIGNGITNTPNERMIRAALVDAYGRRCGEKAAAELGVSRKTIQRDLDWLRSNGVDSKVDAAGVWSVNAPHQRAGKEK